MIAAARIGCRSPKRGERQGDEVVAEGPQEVGQHGPADHAGDGDDPGQQPQAAGRQDERRRLAREVGGGADRDPDIRLGEDGPVVEAVADHRDRLAAAAMRLQRRALALGRQARLHLCLRHADERGDPPGGMRQVARQEHHPQAEVAKLPIVARASGSGVSSRDEEGVHAAPPADMDHASGRSPPATARAPQAPARSGQPRSRIRAALPAATGSPPARPWMPRPGTARTSSRRRPRRGRAPRPRRRRRRPAVLRMALQPGGPGEDLVLAGPVGLDGGETRPAGGERPGLVEREHLHARQRLQGGGIADEAAAARQPPDAERGRERRGEADRAGTGDDQHRQPGQQRPIERQGLRPIEHGQRAEDDDEGHGDADHPVGEALDRAAAGQRRRARSGRSAPSGCPFPRRCVRIRSGPSMLMLPAITAEPAALPTGRLSPVITASSALDSPSSTTPSTGMRSPGRTRTSIPAPISRTATRVSVSPTTSVAHRSRPRAAARGHAPPRRGRPPRGSCRRVNSISTMVAVSK